MKLVNEFKEFAMKGNVVDMAVGIIIGAAFGKIVTSLVNDVIMPPIGVLIGGMNFKELSVTLQKATEETPAVVLAYGNFIQTLVDFLIVALSLFVVIKVINTLRRSTPAAPAQPAS